MKNKTIWIVISIFLLVLCFSSCDEMRTNDTQTNDAQTKAHEHDLSNSVKENVVDPTCDKKGSYDEVVYCAVCEEEVSRTKKTTPIVHQYSDKKCTVCGTDQPSDGLEFESNGNGTCSVLSIGSCKDEKIIIPTVSPSGEKVTKIAASAFYNCAGVTSIRIPDTVTSIGDGAFQGCPDLETVTLPNNLTKISKFMFKDCKKLSNVTIPSRVTKICEEAFVECIAFESIVIPASVNVIEKNAFRNFSLCDGTIKFEKDKTWWCYDSSGRKWIGELGYLVLTDERENAFYLTFRFNDYTWKRV